MLLLWFLTCYLKLKLNLLENCNHCWKSSEWKCRKLRQCGTRIASSQPPLAPEWLRKGSVLHTGNGGRSGVKVGTGSQPKDVRALCVGVSGRVLMTSARSSGLFPSSRVGLSSQHGRASRVKRRHRLNERCPPRGPVNGLSPSSSGQDFPLGITGLWWKCRARDFVHCRPWSWPELQCGVNEALKRTCQMPRMHFYTILSVSQIFLVLIKHFFF